MSTDLSEVSKFLSYILRHRPDSIGLTLDSEGWAKITDLIACSKNIHIPLTLEVIKEVVVKNKKRRFALSLDGLSIRAVQGHSLSTIAISYSPKIPPKKLYHGTATRFLEQIYFKGLMSGSRQYVHLSEDIQSAYAIGQRHGKPIVLGIEAATMYDEGFEFYQAENGIWLTKYVPSEFLSNVE